METVKFICEFFFGNFLHWLGLMLLIAMILPWEGIRITFNSDKKDKKDEKVCEDSEEIQGRRSGDDGEASGPQ